MSDSEKSKDSKSFWATLPGILTGCAAIITAIGSVIAALAAIGIFGPQADPPAPTTPPTTVVVEPTANPTQAIIPTVEPIPVEPKGNSQGELPLVGDFPVNYNCPYRADGIWLQSPGFVYGPFWNSDGTAHSISYDSQYIYVSHSVLGPIGPFNDPAISNQRNQWVTLNTTPFLVCVDSIGSVFVAHIP